MFTRVQKAPEKPLKAISFNELIEMKQAIDREIASRKDTEIEALKSRATAAASALGIPLTELFGINVPVVTMPAPERRKAKRAAKSCIAIQRTRRALGPDAAGHRVGCRISSTRAQRSRPSGCSDRCHDCRLNVQPGISLARCRVSCCRRSGD